MSRFLSTADQSSLAHRPIHGVLIGAAFKRLVITAQTGMRPNGSLPETLEEQTEQAFENVATLIGAAGLSREDVLRIAVYVVTPHAKLLIDQVVLAKLGALRQAVAVRQVVSLSELNCFIEVDLEAVREG